MTQPGSIDVSRRSGRRRRRVARVAALTALLAALLVTGVRGSSADTPPQGRPDSLGTEFWLGFLENATGTIENSLFITGPTATNGMVSVPGAGFSVPFSVTPGSVTTVNLPNNTQMTGNRVVQHQGIHVIADDEIAVYGLSRQQHTTDAYLGLPVDILGTEHLSMGWDGPSFGQPELGVVAVQDGTEVTIVKRDGSPPIEVVLDQGETFQVQESDLDGASVTSTEPVAVYGGNQCAYIPNGSTFYCDHVVQQIPPTDTWGQQFVAMPLKTRTISDTFKVLASVDGTTLSIDGEVVTTLDRGEVHVTQLGVESGHTISADHPVLVAQYSNGSTFDGVTSDPFMMLVPPFEQFLGDYTVTTPASGFSQNFINVVAPTTSVGSVLLDGVPIPAAEFTSIGTSGFSGAMLDVAVGSHSLSGPEAFGVFTYGFDAYDSYGYPGGLSLAPIARATEIDLTPAAATALPGTEHCVTARVVDQDGGPLEGIRVDFERTGTHPGTAFAHTDAAGQAPHCYTGTDEGDDTITATSGPLSASAEVTWTTPAPPPDCVEDGLGSLPLGGLVSGGVHDLEPVVGDLVPGADDLVHDLNCDLVVPTEDLLDELIVDLGVASSSASPGAQITQDQPVATAATAAIRGLLGRR